MTAPFYVIILGSGSAIPKKGRNHTSQLLVYNNRHFLVDCGEGTQIQLQKFGQSIQKIEAVFISHLHGDHYLGLAGLVSSMNLLGREKKLSIYGPELIKEVIDLHFKLAGSRSTFHIEYHFTKNDEKRLILNSDQIRVYSFPLKHKIATTGFLFEAGSLKRKMRPDLLEKYNVPKGLRAGIRDGLDYKMTGGKIISNSELTDDPPEPRRFAYCTDTAYVDNLHQFFPKPEVVYHEATFNEEDISKAKENFHSTGKQAAKVALSAEAGKLIIGHFSNKYPGGTEILKEAKEIFENTEIALEGERYEIT